MRPVKSVAIIGTGPAGAIAVDAFAQEKAFDVIRVFERREKAGGCWCVFLPVNTYAHCLALNPAVLLCITY